MSLKISRILHAGYLIEHGDVAIAFDPIFENPFSKNCFAFPRVEFDHEQIKKLKLAAVFISHFHDDHCSLESLNLLDRSTPIYIYCLFEELLEMIRDLGFAQVYSLSIDKPITIGAMNVTPRRALDVEVDSLFQIEASGLNVLNVVDSWIDDETLSLLAKLGPWDLIMWPFQTMRELEVLSPSRADVGTVAIPEEWIPQLQKLNPRFLVPSSCQFVQESWSWYNHALFPISYAHFQKEMAVVLPKTTVVRMDPSVSVQLCAESSLEAIKKISPISWVHLIGELDVDYEYRPFEKPMTTAEIAKKFTAIEPEQIERVYKYLRTELLDRYEFLGPSNEDYFQKPRYWRLSVYDDKGKAEEFYYQVECDRLELADAQPRPIEWSTEISLTKLWGALENGETLSSLYFRINDIQFEPEIESEVRYADLVEDPLIRCLFNGVFGAYQRAQLNTIRARL